MASKNRVLDKQRLAEEAEKVDRQIAQYLTGLDETDAAEPPEIETATAQALAALKARRDELNRLSACLNQDDRSLIVDGEPDARPMGFGRGGKPPSYNVQIAVDADTGIVIHNDVTDEVNDIRMLHPMAKPPRTFLARRPSPSSPMPAIPMGMERRLRGGRNNPMCARQAVGQ